MSEIAPPPQSVFFIKFSRWNANCLCLNDCYCLSFAPFFLKISKNLSHAPVRYHSFVSKPVVSPADTVRKLNVHKTFRGRPGRLLNVLCTFNLRPVPMGSNRNITEKALFGTMLFAQYKTFFNNTFLFLSFK